MKVIDKNKNKAVEVDSVSNNGEIYKKCGYDTHEQL